MANDLHHTIVKEQKALKDWDTDGDQLVTDSLEIEALLDYAADASDYGCLFVRQADGEVTRIIGMESNVPFMDHTAYRLEIE